MSGETYTTYDQVGLAEDVSDVISNISPTKTPFQTAIGSEKVSARLFEWQEDSLRAPADNKFAEGFVAADVARSATSMRSNYTQILSDTFRISKTADAVKTYGRAKETAYQLAKSGEELKRDLEFAFVGQKNAAVAGDESTPREMAASFNQIDSGNVEAGGTAALTETMLLNNHEAVFNAGGDPDIFMIKPSDSLIVANFTAASGRQREFSGDTKKIVNVVDLYVSPFGELKVVLNRWLLSTTAMLIDTSMWKKVVLRNWSRTLLGVDGDAERHMLVGEFSLKHKNFKASGYIDAIT